MSIRITIISNMAIYKINSWSIYNVIVIYILYDTYIKLYITIYK